MARFKEVLKNRNFLFLWLGQIISQFGDRLNQMALIALISARAPGSSLQLAKTLSFTIIPVFLVGPIAASYVDRWDRRRTMVCCDFLRAVLVALIFFPFIRFTNIWPIYIIIFLVFSISRFFVPAKMAIIPELVPQEKLLLANSLSSLTGMVGAVAGFGLGGLLVERVGSHGGFLLDALTYLASGIFILMITASRVPYFKKIAFGDKSMRFPQWYRIFTFQYHKQKGSPAQEKSIDVPKLLQKTLFADIKEGWQHLARDKNTRFVAQMFFLLGSAMGAVSVVIIVFVQSASGSITRDLGTLAMFLGIGLFCGALIYGRFGEKLSKVRIIFVSLGVSGIVLSVFTIFLRAFGSTLVGWALSLLLGFSLSPIIISSQTLVHEVTHKKMRGRIFGSLDIVAYLAFFLFMFLSAFLAERIGRFWILLSVGAMLTIVGFGAIFLKIDSRKD